jgi:hypothetical protein
MTSLDLLHITHSPIPMPPADTAPTPAPDAPVENLLGHCAAVVAELKDRKPNPFDLLLRDIHHAQDEFMYKHGERPKTVFLGFAQTKAFEHIPPWQIVRDPKVATQPEQIGGLEVIRVLKDSFLQVA